MEIKKKYSNGRVTILWEPAKCIHSANCVKGLPEVFNNQKKPWISPENASDEAIIAQVSKCPSGALSMLGSIEKEIAVTNKITVTPNGPLMLSGSLEIIHPDGKVEHREKNTAFCRCGGSANKPYCDGSHRKNGFEG